MTAWYINRSAGLVAWALLAASIGLGVLLSSKLLGTRVRPNWQLDLHRGLSALAVAFTGVHVAGAVADNWIDLSWSAVLVPGTSSWRPWAIAWGVVTMYLLVAVQATSLLRKRLSKRAWKRVHVLSYPLFLTATAHGITAGTELGTTVGIGVAALVTAGLAGLTAMRVVDELERAKAPAPARTPRPALRPQPDPRRAVATDPASRRPGDPAPFTPADPLAVTPATTVDHPWPAAPPVPDGAWAPAAEPTPARAPAGSDF